MIDDNHLKLWIKGFREYEQQGRAHCDRSGSGHEQDHVALGIAPRDRGQHKQ